MQFRSWVILSDRVTERCQLLRNEVRKTLFVEPPYDQDFQDSLVAAIIPIAKGILDCLKGKKPSGRGWT